MMPRAHALLLSTALAFAACATDRPTQTAFDRRAGYVVVEVCGDGFVRTGERRLPLDALVLELRRQVRSMSRDEVSRYVVRLRVSPDVRGGAAAKVAQDGLNRFVDQLHIMGVRQVEYL